MTLAPSIPPELECDWDAVGVGVEVARDWAREETSREGVVVSDGTSTSSDNTQESREGDSRHS